MLGCFVLGAFPILAQQTGETPSLSICREAREKRDVYLGIWKSQFLKRNRIDQTYFDNHVRVRDADVECSWQSGLSFRVQYTVTFGWAAIEAQDQLVILLYESESAYRHLPLGRDRPG